MLRSKAAGRRGQGRGQHPPRPCSRLRPVHGSPTLAQTFESGPPVLLSSSQVGSGNI